MPSYFVTGVSRGLGYEFLRQLSSDPKNTIIGLVRDKASTDKKLLEDIPTQLANVHILQGDMNEYAALKKAVEDTAQITKGSIDFVIANAGHLSTRGSEYDSVGELGERPEFLEQELLDAFKTNVIANIHLFNLLMPLILKGTVKKVVVLGSGLADPEPVLTHSLDHAVPYSISKIAMNMAIAKFSAQYAKDGVLFLSISPGVVNTGAFDDMPEKDLPKVGAVMAKFAAYAPHFTGPSSAESSIKDMLAVINASSVENGNGGTAVSHKGNQNWLG